MKEIIIKILFIQLSSFVQAQYQTNVSDIGTDYYLDPIYAGNNPDSSILRDGDYYIVHSSFKYYLGLLIWKPKNLINRVPVTNALNKHM